MWLCAVVDGYLYAVVVDENGDSCEKIIDLIKESSTSLFCNEQQRCVGV